MSYKSGRMSYWEIAVFGLGVVVFVFILFVFNQTSLGYFLGTLALIGIWSLCCWPQALIRRRKRRKYSQQSQIQKKSSNNFQKVSSTSLSNNKYTKDFKYCPKCGAKTPLANRYCYECGFQFTD